jgi:hypothetical protein
MSDLETIMERLNVLSLEDTKRVGRAVLNHLEELDDIAAYDQAKTEAGAAESLDSILRRYLQTPEA